MNVRLNVRCCHYDDDNEDDVDYYYGYYYTYQQDEMWCSQFCTHQAMDQLPNVLLYISSTFV